MSLYREARQGRRWVLAALGVGLVVGLLAGFACGRASSDSSPSLERAIADLRSRSGTASDALELLSIEYPQAVRDGRVVAATEYSAVERDLATARSTIADIRLELELLAPTDAESVAERLEGLAALVRRRAAAATVIREAQAATEALRRATRAS